MLVKSYHGPKGNVKEYSRDTVALSDKRIIIANSTSSRERNTAHVPNFLLFRLRLFV